MRTYSSDTPGAAVGIGVLVALALALGLGLVFFWSSSKTSQREMATARAEDQARAEADLEQRKLEKLAQERLDQEAATISPAVAPNTANDPAPLAEKAPAAPAAEESKPPAEANEPAVKRQQAFLLHFEDRNIDDLNALLAKGWRVVNTCALNGANQFNSRCLIILEKP